MTTPATDNERALKALIAYIDRERGRRRAEIMDAAEREASELIQEGLRAARQRVHAAVDQERRDRRAQLRSAHASEQSRIREREHEIVREHLAHAWRALERQLERLWAERDARGRWLAATLEAAARHLPDGEWLLEHPHDCGDEDLEPALERLHAERAGIEVECQQDTDMAGGVRVRCGNAVLDATVPALLRRREYIEGLLLGALARRREIPVHESQAEVEA